MSLNPHNLELLRKLGRELPQHIQPPSNPSKKKHQHQIEIENDPEALFHELMKASPDGNVPSHLLNRLKELETKGKVKKNSILTPNLTEEENNSLNQPSPNLKQKSLLTPNSQLTSLYEDFEDLLLDSE